MHSSPLFWWFVKTVISLNTVMGILELGWVTFFLDHESSSLQNEQLSLNSTAIFNHSMTLASH